MKKELQVGDLVYVDTCQHGCCVYGGETFPGQVTFKWKKIAKIINIYPHNATGIIIKIAGYPKEGQWRIRKHNLLYICRPKEEPEKLVSLLFKYPEVLNIL